MSYILEVFLFNRTCYIVKDKLSSSTKLFIRSDDNKSSVELESLSLTI